MIQFSDEKNRETALDASCSFIVQAPAGSGKTELLTHRFLALLSYVEEPEECLAITFTRKAAHEMRARIIKALVLASKSVLSMDSQQRRTYQLAKKALVRNKQKAWNLLENPHRLKIQTIDSFCSNVTRRMPLASRFGAKLKVVHNPDILYDLSVNVLLNMQILTRQELLALNVLLSHLDNNVELLKKLLVILLPLREQWLPYLVQTHDGRRVKSILEESLKILVKETLVQLCKSIPDGLDELPQIVAKAAKYLIISGEQTSITACVNLLTWPKPELSELSKWLGLAEILLTKKGQWRKKLTQRQGFPSPSLVKENLIKLELEQHKLSMHTCLDVINSAMDFLENMQLLKQLPPICYSIEQFNFVRALTFLLPRLVTQLKLVFRDKGETDFQEVSIAAQLALNDSELANELCLALGYKIRHVLVDEFQDTSIVQFKLIEQLTAGWVPRDGRTLFLVGDPMQSIYRFRQAEVSLFVTARQYGIGKVKLHALNLTANFRSTSIVVNWCNRVFSKAFPKQDNITLGAIHYTPSIAVGELPESKVSFFIVPDADWVSESQKIVQLIKNYRCPTDETIAILVRSRSHLIYIIAALEEAKLPYQGVEIELLSKKPTVQNLLALTRALLHMTDRIAWLAVLRAPWCGLSLSDIHALCGYDHITCIWTQLQAFSDCEQLSISGNLRLASLIPKLNKAFDERGRLPISRWIEKIWYLIGGDLCLQKLESYSDVCSFFDLLKTYDNNPKIFEVDFFERQLIRLFSTSGTIDAKAIQVMTIHKAKGLEFDTVILPGLGRKPKLAQEHLIRWNERSTVDGKRYLLLAPMRAVGKKIDPIYQYLKFIDMIRERYESVRLLYVAVTRAKKNLYGFGHLIGDKPRANSLLSLVWKQMLNVHSIEHTFRKNQKKRKSLQRLPFAVMLLSQVSYDLPCCYKKKLSIPSFELTRYWIRHVGTVVHQAFYQIATHGIQIWKQIPRLILIERWEQSFQGLGLPNSKLSSALSMVELAVSNTLRDPKGCWILDLYQHESHSEWALAAHLEGKIVQIIVDRTFIDQDGFRWIIDFKVCLQKNIQTILFDYKVQLSLYKKVLASLFSDSKFKTALYFPLQASFYEMKVS